MIAGIDDSAEFGVEDDFTKLDTAATNGQWAAVNDGATGTIALGTTIPGGWINIPTAAADNDYHMIATIGKPFQFTTGRPLSAEMRFRLTEANTDDANFIFGVSSITTTGLLASDGAGPPASYDGAVIFKVDGGTVLQAETSAAGAQVTSTSLATFTSGSTYRIGFTFDPNDGTTGVVRFNVTNETAGTVSLSSEHKITLSGLGLMHGVIGVKAGGANAETLMVDKVVIKQSR